MKWNVSIPESFTTLCVYTSTGTFNVYFLFHIEFNLLSFSPLIIYLFLTVKSCISKVFPSHLILWWYSADKTSVWGGFCHILFKIKVSTSSWDIQVQPQQQLLFLSEVLLSKQFQTCYPVTIIMLKACHDKLINTSIYKFSAFFGLSMKSIVKCWIEKSCHLNWVFFPPFLASAMLLKWR